MPRSSGMPSAIRRCCSSCEFPEAASPPLHHTPFELAYRSPFRRCRGFAQWARFGQPAHLSRHSPAATAWPCRHPTRSTDERQHPCCRTCMSRASAIRGCRYRRCRHKPSGRSDRSTASPCCPATTAATWQSRHSSAPCQSDNRPRTPLNSSSARPRAPSSHSAYSANTVSLAGGFRWCRTRP